MLISRGPEDNYRRVGRGSKAVVRQRPQLADPRLRGQGNLGDFPRATTAAHAQFAVERVAQGLSLVVLPLAS